MHSLGALKLIQTKQKPKKRKQRVRKGVCLKSSKEKKVGPKTSRRRIPSKTKNKSRRKEKDGMASKKK